jgi:1-hydroxycarotenoid 3,4-desaturase
MDLTPQNCVATQPADFERLFPATGGALYGLASHGWRASFSRPPARSRLAGLYLAGGSTHPGPGVPMAALSGRLAAASLLADVARRRASTPAWPMAATPGGTSTR